MAECYPAKAVRVNEEDIRQIDSGYKTIARIRKHGFLSQGKNYQNNTG